MAKKKEQEKPVVKVITIQDLRALLKMHEHGALEHFNKYLSSNARIDRDRCLKSEAKIALLRSLLNDLA